MSSFKLIKAERLIQGCCSTAYNTSHNQRTQNVRKEAQHEEDEVLPARTPKQKHTSSSIAAC